MPAARPACAHPASRPVFLNVTSPLYTTHESIGNSFVKMPGTKNSGPTVPKKKNTRGRQQHGPQQAVTPAWVPHHHSCGHSGCTQKTTSSKFRRQCLFFHEEPCPAYHRTLLRVGCTASCDSCIREREEDIKRQKGLHMKKQRLEQEKTKCWGAIKSREARRLAAEVEHLEREIHTTKENTEHNKRLRKDGFEAWNS